MFNFIIHSTKALLTGLWILAILGLASINPLPVEYQLYLLPLAGIVLLAHLLEYFAMKAKVKTKSNTEISFVQTMLWGFGHWLPLLNKSIEK
ncbi:MULTISPECIES: DUF1145 domain-containing protein [Colwellia]|uniref:DUF1145 domain-containing protein n=1 Tax=Colwellia psychrerythraea (strain 34H / ATCC BAA-681) TaxID=167879 RepID=Q47YL0_COLP3|nr:MULTISPECIES: DUF1145 domain-containing protein [Colwellia]AAZ24940.1 hypothetical protein CPS_3435 [Colwellia psychrerythraea 34H]PKH86941.1 DUF1145 domain-containing protein [Colwellia sp. Bg11-28]